MTAVPRLILQVAFATNPSSGSPVWTDLSNRLVGVTTRTGRPYELSTTETGELTLELRNDDGALDPTNTSSPYYPNVLPLRQVRLQAVIGGSTVNLFTGYVERWPMTDRLRNVYFTQVRAFDVFGVLAQRVLRDYYTETVLAAGPLAYYPLQESTSSAGAAATMFNSAATGVPGVSLTPVPGGTLAAPGGSCPLFETTSGLTFSAAGGGSSLRLPAAANPPVPNGSAYPGAMLEAWYQASSPPPVAGAVVTFGNPAFTTLVFAVGGVGGHTQPAMPMLELNVQPNGYPQAATGVGVTLAAGPVQQPNTVTASTYVCDGKPHHLVAVIDTSGTNALLRLYVDGTASGAPVTLGPSATLPANQAGAATGNYVSVGGGGLNYQNSPYMPLSGVVAHVATWGAYQSNAAVTSRYVSGSTGDPVTYAPTRLSTLLGFASPAQVGLTSLSPTSVVDPIGPATGLAGTSLLDAVQQLANSVGGVLAVDPTQGLVFMNRQYRWTQTTAGTVLGDAGGSGEVPFDAVTFDFDPQYVYNDVTVTNQATGSAVRMVDSASQSTYLARTYTSQGRYSRDAVASERAGWLLATYKQPRVRPAGLTFSPAAVGGSALSTLTSLTVGSRVQIRRRPFGASGRAITVDAFVEGIRHQVTATEWRTALDVSPAGLQPAIADSAAYGPADNANFPAAY